jgi:site-specific recombinase XerD
MEKLTTKLKYLPPSATENNNFLSTIQNYEQDLKQLIKKLETSESESAKEVKENIDNTVSAVVSEIEILRKSFKS